MLQWFVLRVQSGREFATIAALRDHGLKGAYAPAETRLRRTNKGPRKVRHPLIPSYVFLPAGPESPSVYEALRLWQVLDLLRKPCGAAQEIDPTFINALKASEAAGEFDHTPQAKEFRKGQKVRISAGPWTGYIGEIINAKPGKRAQVMLSGIFGGGSGVPVDPKHLEAA